MPSEKETSTLQFRGQVRLRQSDWHGAQRQAQRDAIRLRWARNLLDEESKQSGTHSVARIRRATGIISAFAKEPEN